MDRSGGGPAAVTVSTPTPTEASGGADSASKGARSGGKSNWSPGDLVWGKVKGHGFWPGRVVDPQRHSKVMGMPHSHSSVLVQFFDNTLGWANKVELQDLEANWEKMAVLKKSSAFKDALRTARKAVTHAKARGPVKRRDERVGSPSSGKAETPTGGAGTSSVKKEPRRDSPGKVDAPPKKAPPPVDRENLIGIAARGLADRKRPAPGSLKDGFPMGVQLEEAKAPHAAGERREGGRGRAHQQGGEG
ncbi:unnamed protein product [Pedinophyceae sp. YPF-701]|nr:unnamed protein product [Pedinophyceae sp. YPF-701]